MFEKFFTFRSSNLNNYFEKALPINFSRTLDKFHTLDNFSFTLDNYNIRFNRTLENLRTTKGASHCYFRQAVLNKYFQKVLQINFISTHANLLQNFSFVHFLLINFNSALENMCTVDDFNFTNFLIDRAL